MASCCIFCAQFVLNRNLLEANKYKLSEITFKVYISIRRLLIVVITLYRRIVECCASLCSLIFSKYYLHYKTFRILTIIQSWSDKVSVLPNRLYCLPFCNAFIEFVKKLTET
ncbi:Schizosaccharomyces pombe specific protein [Schizosaccharomyces pombe]|uniref:Putative uncharacterized protein C13G1.15c n=1 Tax=Schizosaccharomyces pombe (strain 972 / ATCC 24843) TaxID=284812 RepID=YBBF_SCHPO|nr:uncharacterized protein SPBC13G1.15c [Schizosaccharomyces pombe]Q9C0X3.1 RecName: Full=Putative uncharacterized protein C13G1.15c [Schizosaccharomyces pombe 972h-]CAC34973.1 sequence orphan [Schizosaccharomyces pombe]|eukprot:NP_596558.1 uncharacterized protein SPBC13G1.15c [Schizosaccharomyces pombe]